MRAEAALGRARHPGDGPSGRSVGRISFLGEVDSDSWSLSISFLACLLKGMPCSPLNSSVAEVVIRLARPDERLRRNRLIAERHELGFLRFVGRRLRYVAVLGTLWVSSAGWRARATVPSATGSSVGSFEAG